jgi:Flp pilus assembly protein TadB
MDWFLGFVLFSMGFAIATIVFSFYYVYMQRKIENMQSQSLLEDLEYATKEQLLKEFRNRPNNSYILLSPMNTQDETGMKIELNSFTPYDSVSLLHLATMLIFKEMKKKGMSVPDLPEIQNED